MTKVKKPVQLQNFNNTKISYSQIGQSLGVLYQNDSKSLDPQDIIELIDDIQSILKGSDLPGELKTKCNRNLQCFKEEVQEEVPDKDYAAHTLQKVIHVLQETKQNESFNFHLKERLQPMITRIVPWLGEAKKFLKI